MAEIKLENEPELYRAEIKEFNVSVDMPLTPEQQEQLAPILTPKFTHTLNINFQHAFARKVMSRLSELGWAFQYSLPMVSMIGDKDKVEVNVTCFTTKNGQVATTYDYEEAMRLVIKELQD